MTPPEPEPSERALKIVECVPHHWRCDPSGGLKEVEPCGPRCDRYTTAQDIDTAIQAARDEACVAEQGAVDETHAKIELTTAGTLEDRADWDRVQQAMKRLGVSVPGRPHEFSVEELRALAPNLQRAAEAEQLLHPERFALSPWKTYALSLERTIDELAARLEKALAEMNALRSDIENVRLP